MATQQLNPSVPTPEQIGNRQLAGGTPPPAGMPQGAGAPTLGDASAANAGAARSLSDYLTTGSVTPQESSYEGGIMNRYTQAQDNTKTAYQNEYGAISAGYSNQLDQLNRSVQNDTNTAAENNMGVNASVMKYLSETGTNRIATLENARDEALLSNNANMANSLNKLLTDEQGLITQARQNFVSNLTSAATLKTPEQEVQLEQQKNQQASVVQMQQLAPDAGITSSDSFDAATAKFRNSQYYKNNINQAEATIALGNAQANLANIQATATARGLSFLGGGGSSGGSGGAVDEGDVQALIDNQKDPTKGMTPEQLSSKYKGTMSLSVGGVNVDLSQQKIAATIAAAQKRGYQPQGAALGSGAAEANAQNLGGGGYGALFTGGTNLLGDYLGGATGSNPLAPSRSLSSTPPTNFGDTVTMTGPKGTYKVSRDKVTVMQSNGYTIVGQ